MKEIGKSRFCKGKSAVYLDWKWSSGWLESWQGLLLATDVSTTCAGAIFTWLCHQQQSLVCHQQQSLSGLQWPRLDDPFQSRYVTPVFKPFSCKSVWQYPSNGVFHLLPSSQWKIILFCLAHACVVVMTLGFHASSIPCRNALGHVHTYPELFFFPQIFFCGYENFCVHTQRIQMVWYPIVSGNEHAHNYDFGVISSAP